MDRPNLPYPTCARSERIADGVVHVMGVAFAIAGAAYLITVAMLYAEGGRAVAVAIYGAALIGTFVASASYHLAPWDHVRPTLRRIDHAAIFMKIAGTFTPLAILVESAVGWVILILVWSLALAGAAAKMFFWREPGRLGFAVYLALGWLGVILFWPLTATLPAHALILAAAGGALYTLGVAFFAWENLRFSTAIWHAFVLAASGCFFAAISLGVFA